VVARLRAEGESGQDRRFEAQGDIPALGAGLRVTLDGEPLPGTGEDYLCLVAHHSYTSDNYGSGGEVGDGYAYTGRYVLLPSDAPLVPELKTARADVKGPQTAEVVGDGEIDCDEFGRILVQFHWDLDAAYSMRCRVSQSWAGNGWGGMVIPRVGMEVVVEFLDGDPDKPLVTGCVYNGKNAVPYDLPEHKTRSTFRTDTHEGEGFNELRFEDKKGEEEVFLHAQKDQNIEVESDKTEFVGKNKIRHVGENLFVETRHNRHETVGMSMQTQVRGDRYDFIGGVPLLEKLQETVDRRREGLWRRFRNLPKLTGIGNWMSFVTGYRISSTALDDSENIGGSKTISAGGFFNVSANASASISARENIVVDADESIIIRTGDSAIVLKKDGKIAISGTQLLLSTGETAIEADKSVSVKATKIKLN